ncbi:transglycosylase domain-containing protein [Caldimonas thermodepolymerans]|uniref:Penicillin-binding protein 1A n=1 Tax=Caldimonas thermodepolymerans TaxID=215580 RepID=A0A2S5T740_9BURK|nr:transglycosylase domain-containing protein [Caldimonas thermodepolymerans]PPE70677.1 penicillin-binding protein [Caldimonas thermodepolymerans]QPC33234.1 transglycosylase domain-containing protein [Caldimonas thermodepolymerans]RDH97557.1 penicillin-binding protein 1A [Caldimonas thermodepolymerans]TCP09969.1 penicillin-binding protein 1A [Caldimonas thermodepolymerans]UZG46353.1 transglycosylase domain-containing protein [Caldimonas thermodepolymerans]
MSAPPSVATGPARRWWHAVPAGMRGVLRVVSVGLAAGAALLASATMLAGICYAVAYPHLPDLGELTDYRPRLPMRVYAADGVLLGEYGEERRHFLSLDEIPQVMQDALLSVEDARFHQHGGIDFLRVLGASLHNLVAPLSQGASTITMQLARNFYLPTEKTFTRKLYEAMLALKIESQLGKRQILETYMNQIYLGQRAYGFAAASEIYFGKPLQDVTLAEAALLAGLPQSPSRLDPLVNPQRAKARQLVVLERMYRNGIITREQRDAAGAEPLHYRAREQLPPYARPLAETARRIVVRQYGSEAYTRGLNVHLTVTSSEQEAAYRAVREAVLAHERGRPYRGPEGEVRLPDDPEAVDERVAEALRAHPDRGELLAAVVLEAQPGRLQVMLRDGTTVTLGGPGLALAPHAATSTPLRRGAIVRVWQSQAGAWQLTQLPRVEAALVALDPRDGAVRAWVGGFAPRPGAEERVAQGGREAGTSLAPFIYAAALEQGHTASTVVEWRPGAPEVAGQGEGTVPEARNDVAPLVLRQALAAAQPETTRRLVEALGPDQVQAWLRRFGFDPASPPDGASMTAGTEAITPLQLASAHAVLANGGYRVRPVLVRRLTDADGRVLKETLPRLPGDSARVIDARNAFVITRLLHEASRMNFGGRAGRWLHRPDVQGHAGSTRDGGDAWFAGFQPGVVAVAWVGDEPPRPHGERDAHGKPSLPIWLDYMRFALRDTPVMRPAVPDGVVNIDGQWYYREYTPDSGIRSLDPAPPAGPSLPADSLPSGE